MAHDWRNRIVEVGEADPASLIPNSKNFRRHPSRQRRVLAAVLDEVGYIQDIIVNRRTGRMLDGHLRVELAIRQKQPTVPVKYVDLAEHEEALVLATFDPVGSLAYLDMDAMAHLKDAIDSPNEAIADLLVELAPPSFPDDEEDDAPDDDDDLDDTPADPGYTLRLSGRVVPMSGEEFRRLDDAFLAFVESRGMPFGFVRWLVTP